MRVLAAVLAWSSWELCACVVPEGLRPVAVASPGPSTTSADGSAPESLEAHSSPAPRGSTYSSGDGEPSGGRATGGGRRRPCMFDPSNATYRECAHPSMGRCHHYTTTCEPDCMWNPKESRHQRCAHPSMGRCHHYTTTCEPDCMWNPKESKHQRCAHPSMGACHHFTTTCEP